MADEKQFSRRDFLKTTGVATGGIIGGSLLGGLIGFNLDGKSGNSSNDSGDQGGGDSHGGHDGHGGGGGMFDVPDKGRVFFENDADFATIEAAMERIFPETDVGPGAKGLGAAYFLDGQLAGAYGFNSKEYMQGPFYEGLPTQGYQSNLNRAEYFRLGVKKLQEEAKSRHDDSFSQLDEKKQDEILKDFQEGKVDFGVPKSTATSSYFFTMLRSATLEGAYCDPIYHGNRNMEGWKMKQFPGHQHSYLDVIESDEFMDIEPLPNFG